MEIVTICSNIGPLSNLMEFSSGMIRHRIQWTFHPNFFFIVSNGILISSDAFIVSMNFSP